jgi:DNA-binding transcriptional LysR family regulator
METNRLKQFCTIVETGSLRKASDLLGISHSGLSKSMKAFELEVGFTLFQASGRGIAITDLGRNLYEKSPAFISQLNHLLGSPEETKFVRIGSFEVFTSFFMGRLLKNYLPDTGVEVHELIPGQLEESLSLNRIDLGITYEPIPRQGIEYVKVKTLTMGIYVRRGSFQNVSITEIPFVIPASPLEGTPSGVRGRDGWPDERIRRNVRYRVDLMTTGLEFVKQGLCAIFIPQFVAQFYNEDALPELKLEARPLPKKMGQVKRDVYIVKRESTVEDKIIKQVAKALRNLE